MSEQQSGAGYPQQPTSGQPQQQAYPQAPYASPQAQYQAQQQQYAYAPPAPSLFDKLGVPSMPAILGLCGLGSLVLAGLIAGTSSGGSDEFGRDGTVLSSFVSGELSGGVLSLLVAVIVLFALTLCYVLNVMDRSQILAASIQAIKRDFGATDFQLGMLSGVPFALFYSFLGIPIAAWADRSSRRNVPRSSGSTWRWPSRSSGSIAPTSGGC